MGQVKVIRDKDHEWQEVPGDWPGKAKPGEPQLTYKALMGNGPAAPNLQRTRYEPGHFEPPHSHPEDEVIFVLDGGLSFGDQQLGFGDAIFVPKNTRYSLSAGTAGAEFVRFGMGGE
jgi:quercetin dioxygenase-like cupin family protein